MNKNMFLLGFILFVNNLLLTVTISPQELFLQGNSNFCEGKFDQARHCYEQIPYKNSIVWQNLGNCYYNENNGVKALVCWKRAEKDANFNQLDQLFDSEQRLLKKFDCSYDGIFMRGIKKIILGVPKILLHLLVIILLLLFLYWFYQCFMQKSDTYQLLSCRKRYLIILGLAISICLLLLGAKEKFLKEKIGIIMHDKIIVHAGPEESFHAKTKLPLGCVVQIHNELPNMVKISCDKGSGWITSNHIEIV